LQIFGTKEWHSNEITLNSEKGHNGKKKLESIDGNVVKRLIGGGDDIKSRKLYQNSVSLINKSFMCIMVNDTPNVNPVDDQYKQRASYIRYDRSSSDTISEPNENYFPSDDTIKDWVAQPDICDAFIYMMCYYYINSPNSSVLIIFPSKNFNILLQ